MISGFKSFRQIKRTETR